MKGLSSYTISMEYFLHDFHFSILFVLKYVLLSFIVPLGIILPFELFFQILTNVKPPRMFETGNKQATC